MDYSCGVAIEFICLKIVQCRLLKKCFTLCEASQIYCAEQRDGALIKMKG